MKKIEYFMKNGDIIAVVNYPIPSGKISNLKTIIP